MNCSCRVGEAGRASGLTPGPHVSIGAGLGDDNPEECASKIKPPGAAAAWAPLSPRDQRQGRLPPTHTQDLPPAGSRLSHFPETPRTAEVQTECLEHQAKHDISNSTSRTSLAVHGLRLRVQCRGHGFNPRLGNQDPTCLVTCSQKKPKTKKQKKHICQIPLPCKWKGLGLLAV